MLHLDQDERSVISSNCDLQSETGKKGLAKYGGAMARGVVCSRAVAKIQCQRRFCSRSSLGCEEVVAGRISVAVQGCRDSLLGLGSVPELCG